MDTRQRTAVHSNDSGLEQLSTARAAERVQASPQTPAAPSPHGFSLVDAAASIGNRTNLVTDIVMGPDNQVAQIRVIDAVTHQVIAKSPPDSIARMQQEMQAYQDILRSNGVATSEAR